jgi:hypothetical protein
LFKIKKSNIQPDDDDTKQQQTSIINYLQSTTGSVKMNKAARIDFVFLSQISVTINLTCNVEEQCKSE